HEEGLIDTHRAGDLYDMLSTGARLAKATGQWNQTRIVVKGKLIEQWMNGKKALSVTIGSAKWKRIVVKANILSSLSLPNRKKGISFCRITVISSGFEI
ncbi:MAG: family 16 glycoside hydrolase, partial [Verrucomicrobiia bacterium]